MMQCSCRKYLWILLCGILLISCQNSDEKVQIAEISESAAEIQVETAPRGDNLPVLKPAPDTLRIAVISDLNASYGSTSYPSNVEAAISSIIARRPDLVLSPGDLVAGQKEGLNYEAMWRAFHYTVSDPLFDAGIPFVHAPGNHDASAFPQYAAERVAFEEAWQDRKPPFDLAPGSRYPFYYALMIKGVLIISLDLTRPAYMDVFQFEWLEDTLKNHRNARYRIVMGHLPLAPLSYLQLWQLVAIPAFEELLFRYKVDLYLSGHHHAYYPAHISNLRLVGAPCLGNAARQLIGSSDKPSQAYVWIEVPANAPSQVSAWKAPDFVEEIKRESLPLSIGRLQREDVGMSEFFIESLDKEVGEISDIGDL